jgi:CheY-like chemotaxis protein
MALASILIVDDDKDDVEILAEAFTQTGVESVHYVHTATQAFMYLQSIEDKEQLPKLIVTDMYLPGITGMEFMANLKRMDKYKHIHVIVLSSVKSRDETEKYKQLGALDYLVKPGSYKEYVRLAKEITERLSGKNLITQFN